MRSYVDLYIALFYIVHLEALKAGMEGLQRRKQRTFLQSLFSFMTVVVGILVMSFVIYYGIGWTKELFGMWATVIVGIVLVASYLALVKYAASYPDLETDDPNKQITMTPAVGPTVKSGLYFLLPIVVLVWCLTVERFSPGLSAFWATVFLLAIVASQSFEGVLPQASRC